MTALPMIPTRFTLCSNEAAGLQGAARQNEMRQCLARRFYAEKTVRKDCKQTVRAMTPPPKNSDERFKAERQCFIDHLSASYKDLPTPPPPPPRPVAKPKQADAESAAPADDAAPVAPPAPAEPAAPAPAAAE